MYSAAWKEVYKLYVQKPLLIMFLLLICIACSLLIFSGQVLVPFLIIAGLTGIIIVYYCVTQPLLGFCIVCFISFFSSYPDKILRTSLGLSTAVELLILTIFLGTYVKPTAKLPRSNFYKTPASIALSIFLIFILIELFNPNMNSIEGWFFYTRRLLMFVLIYITAYRLFQDSKNIKRFCKLWIILAFLTALYACYQQFFGLLPFEMDYLTSNPHVYKLYFQGGFIRKSSFLSDPTTMGIMTGSTSVFVLILGINEKKKRMRTILFFVFVMLSIAMTFSGTRTANIMLIAGLALYSFLTITNKTTLITLFVFFFAAAFILFGPINNNAINRVRTTFDSKDASFNVRDFNRKYIQPYIYSHPLGGGVMTAGVLGEKYNPGHPLAGFPPDSGLLSAAIELGWIGYTISILVYFLFLYQGVHYYFLTKNKENKIIIAALTVYIFSIIVTQYSQVTIGQLPTALFFYSALAFIIRLKEADTLQSKQ